MLPCWGGCDSPKGTHAGNSRGSPTAPMRARQQEVRERGAPAGGCQVTMQLLPHRLFPVSLGGGRMCRQSENPGALVGMRLGTGQGAFFLPEAVGAFPRGAHLCGRRRCAASRRHGGRHLLVVLRALGGNVCGCPLSHPEGLCSETGRLLLHQGKRAPCSAPLPRLGHGGRASRELVPLLHRLPPLSRRCKPELPVGAWACSAPDPHRQWLPVRGRPHDVPESRAPGGGDTVSVHWPPARWLCRSQPWNALWAPLLPRGCRCTWCLRTS